MMSNLYAPLARSYWVVPGRFLAGAYPGAKDIAEARLNIGDLLESGIRCIVNLMEQDEKDHRGALFVSYDLIVKAMASRMRTEVVLLRYPIRDFGVPSTQQMVEILDSIDGAIERGIGLYVHCWGGTGRTGTVVGCHLVRHGLATATDVMDRIAFYRRQDATASRVSPETREQLRLVQSWSKGQ
jgi:protein tyrosine phosphatase